MMRGRLLFVLWCSNILAVAHSITGGANSCVSDYITNITCAWNISDGLVVRSNNYSLKFIDDKRTEFSCPLMATDQGFLCSCIVFTDSNLGDLDKYSIKLCNESACQAFLDDFKPVNNIKLTPPPELELQQSTDSINITCKSERYKSHMFLSDFDYELFLQESNGSWIRTFRLSSARNVETIHTKAHLKPNTEYCIKARFKPLGNTYRGSTWSEWSKSTCWTNAQKEEREDIVLFLLKSLGPVCLIVGILLFVFYNPATRMKIKTLALTPTPAPFFKPLFQEHEGNLQEWLSPHHKHVLTYKTEEDLIANAVTIVPKASPKDLEENQVFLTTPAIQLTFPPSLTSYVGLPGMDKPPIPGVCPGETPYTQLPFSIWGFSIQEVEVVSSEPNDFLEISHSDSGCNCEDLTQSPECSLPCSPVSEIPTPSHRSDYCILNKTAEGVVPVLLSKDHARDVLSGSLKSEG
ncbi:hypothetical protein ATANTOWER_002259 [Ataeniobius toweri]|uniref:Uncharacterized protein n=1 Tax=Ataeniobius toweri TaxID=208326 RepID=A0ABU7AVN1_9TELE|nr:hypothetical protein [Ataeniobius toweri]